MVVLMLLKIIGLALVYIGTATLAVNWVWTHDGEDYQSGLKFFLGEILTWLSYIYALPAILLLIIIDILLCPIYRMFRKGSEKQIEDNKRND